MKVFCEQISIMLKRYPDKRYAIIMMDIDKFKVINDIYGVRGGDKALIYVAELIQKTLVLMVYVVVCMQMYFAFFMRVTLIEIFIR